MSQINENEIVVFGGFSGKFLRDAYYFDVKSKVIRKSPVAPVWDLFAYQMPTVLDKSSGQLITADWASRKIFQYEYDGQFNILKDFKQVDKKA